MAKVRVEFEFDSMDEMLAQLSTSAIARQVGRIRPDPAPPASPESAPPAEAASNAVPDPTPIDSAPSEPAPPSAKPAKEVAAEDAERSNGRPGVSRMRRAYLRHPDGAVLQTFDQDLVDEWRKQGAAFITKAEFDRAHNPRMLEPPTDPPPQPVPPVATPAVEPPAEVPTPPSAPENPPSESLFDRVRVVVKRINAEKGIDALLDLLAEFGCERVSELPEAKYPPFLARAEAILGG